MSKKTLLIGIVIIVLIGTAAWITSQNGPSAPSSDQQQQASPEASGFQPSPAGGTEVPATNKPVAQPNAMKEFTVTGQNYSFAPSALTVKKGDTVKIIFKNLDGLHDFRIDGFNAATKTIRTGEEDTITFVADKTGSFEFYCSVGSHRQMGMKGTLIVQE